MQTANNTKNESQNMERAQKMLYFRPINAKRLSLDGELCTSACGMRGLLLMTSNDDVVDDEVRGMQAATSSLRSRSDTVELCVDLELGIGIGIAVDEEVSDIENRLDKGLCGIGRRLVGEVERDFRCKIEGE